MAVELGDIISDVDKHNIPDLIEKIGMLMKETYDVVKCFENPPQELIA